jgi:hypothetical protein
MFEYVPETVSKVQCQIDTSFLIQCVSRGGSYQKVKKLSPLIGVMIKFKVYETHFL